MTLDPENSEMGENKHDDNRSMACTLITCRDKYTRYANFALIRATKM